MKFTLQDLLNTTGAQVFRWPGPTVGLRPIHELKGTESGSVFFPIHQYQPGPELFRTLERAGASGVVVPAGSWLQSLESFPGLGVLVHSLPHQAYYSLAAVARDKLTGPVIGITGSSGKSSTKDFVKQLLHGKYDVHATVESLNLTSDSAEILLGLEGRVDEAAVLEMGFGWQGDIERMASMAKPTLGIITKVTSAHLDGANGSWEDLIAEKGALGTHIPADGALIVHAEDPGCARLPFNRYVCRVFGFGTGPGVDARYSQVHCDDNGTAFCLNLLGHEVRCQLRSYGAFQAANATGASLVAHLAGIPLPDIQRALAEVPPLPQRFELFRFSRGLTVVDDSFNATADAMLRGFEQTARLAGSRRKVAALSGIAHLGKRAPGIHRIIGEYAVRCGFNEVCLVVDPWSGGIRDGLLAAGLPAERVHMVERNAAIPDCLLALTGPDTLVYCKARHAGEAFATFRMALPAIGFVPFR